MRFLQPGFWRILPFVFLRSFASDRLVSESIAHIWPYGCPTCPLLASSLTTLQTSSRWVGPGGWAGPPPISLYLSCPICWCFPFREEHVVERGGALTRMPLSSQSLVWPRPPPVSMEDRARLAATADRLRAKAAAAAVAGSACAPVPHPHPSLSTVRGRVSVPPSFNPTQRRVFSQPSVRSDYRCLRPMKKFLWLYSRILQVDMASKCVFVSPGFCVFAVISIMLIQLATPVSLSCGLLFNPPRTASFMSLPLS